jgi:beta-lactamase regulating signal transducer with metallopeptidase domain
MSVAVDAFLARVCIELALRAIDAGLAAGILLALLRVPVLRRNLSPHLMHALLWVGLLHFLLPRAPGEFSVALPALSGLAGNGGLARFPTVALGRNLLLIGVGLHLLGFLGVLAAIARQERQLRRWMRAELEVPQTLRAQFEAMARRLGFDRPPRLILSRLAPVPMAAGIFPPAVVLPEWALESLDPEQIDDVVAHELGHLRRRDPWWNALRVVICALWWFHPIVWMLSRALRDLREECCDEAVLASLRLDASHYARTILDAAEIASSPAAQWLASGVLGGQTHPLTSRLHRLLARRKPSCRLPIWGWTLALLLFFGLWSTQPLGAVVRADAPPGATVYLHALGRSAPSEDTSDSPRFHHDHAHGH